MITEVLNNFIGDRLDIESAIKIYGGVINPDSIEYSKKTDSPYNLDGLFYTSKMLFLS